MNTKTQTQTADVGQNRAIEVEQQRETARSIHKQVVALQRAQNISYVAAKRQAQGKPELAQHSPLPWQASESGLHIVAGPFDEGHSMQWTSSYVRICTLNSDEKLFSEQDRKANAKLIVASVNHAEALAEALRKALRSLNTGVKPSDIAWNICEALAAWDAAQ